jgi:hypothetical protein
VSGEENDRMKSIILSLAFASLLFTNCSKSEFSDSIPDCIKSSIEANKNKDDWNIKRVDEYQYQGNTVYIFEADQIYPDMQTPVIKSDCTTLCTLGGIAGITMCNGDRFYDKAKLIRSVWQK